MGGLNVGFGGLDLVAQDLADLAGVVEDVRVEFAGWRPAAMVGWVQVPGAILPLELVAVLDLGAFFPVVLAHLGQGFVLGLLDLLGPLVGLLALPRLGVDDFQVLLGLDGGALLERGRLGLVGDVQIRLEGRGALLIQVLLALRDQVPGCRPLHGSEVAFLIHRLRQRHGLPLDRRDVPIGEGLIHLGLTLGVGLRSLLLPALSVAFRDREVRVLTLVNRAVMGQQLRPFGGVHRLFRRRGYLGLLRFPLLGQTAVFRLGVGHRRGFTDLFLLALPELSIGDEVRR